MNFIIASTFVDSLARLGTPAQTLVKQAAFDLQLAPEHPSFQLHRLERATDKHFWSAASQSRLADHPLPRCRQPGAVLRRASRRSVSLLTTFSKTLAAHLSQNADLLLGSDALERARIDIVHLHKLAQDPWVNTIKRKLVFIKVKRFNELRKLLLPSRAKGLPSAASGHIIAIVGLLGGRIGIDFILPAFTNWSTALLWTIVLIKLAGKS